MDDEKLATHGRIEHGGSLDRPVPLLARWNGRHVSPNDPFVVGKINPLLAKTWEPVNSRSSTPIGNFVDCMRLHICEISIARWWSCPIRASPADRRLIEKWINEAKRLPSSQFSISKCDLARAYHSRGLSRLRFPYADLVLRYELDGEIRQRTDAVSFIAIRIEPEGIIRRRVGTAHLEIRSAHVGTTLVRVRSSTRSIPRCAESWRRLCDSSQCGPIRT